MIKTLRILLIVILVTTCTAYSRDRGRIGQGGIRLDKVKITTDAEYGSVDGYKLKLDIIEPKQKTDKARPAIVFIHGGGWRAGSKRSGISRILPFVEQGDFVGVSVEYRLTGQAAWPAQIHDCKAAIRWLRANADKYGIDPDRIGVWGSSAGGHLVSLLGTSGDVKELEGKNGSAGTSSRVTCVVNFCGPSDFTLWKDSLKANKPDSPVYKLFNGKIEDNIDSARAASPVTHASKDDPPFLIVHGTRDTTVNIEQAEHLYNELKKNGVDATFIKIINGGHGIGGDEVLGRVRAFFHKHLLHKDVQVSSEPIKK